MFITIKEKIKIFMAMLQLEERDELKEEGIELTTVPWINDKRKLSFLLRL